MADLLVIFVVEPYSVEERVKASELVVLELVELRVIRGFQSAPVVQSPSGLKL